MGDIKEIGRSLPDAPQAFVTITAENGISVEAMVNPKEIGVSKKVGWTDRSAVGRDYADLQFTQGSAMTTSLELLFDKYESDGDIRSETDKLLKMALIDENMHRPPTVKVTFGGPLLPFEKAVVTGVDVRFTMFNTKGVPVRATVKIDLQEASGKVLSGNSPDVAKQRMVKRGETLQSIA